MAVKNRPPSKRLIFHSDRGIQYASAEFTKLLSSYSQVERSMSRKGNCWDNAVAESFFKTIKSELVYRTCRACYLYLSGLKHGIIVTEDTPHWGTLPS